MTCENSASDALIGLLGPGRRSSGLTLKLFDSSAGFQLPDGSVLSKAPGLTLDPSEVGQA